MGIVNLLRGVMFWLENHNAGRSHGIFYLGNINDSSVNVCVVFPPCVRASFAHQYDQEIHISQFVGWILLLNTSLSFSILICLLLLKQEGSFFRFFNTKRSTRTCSQYLGESKVVSVTNFWLGHGTNETVSPDMKFVSEHYTLFLKMPNDIFFCSVFYQPTKNRRTNLLKKLKALQQNMLLVKMIKLKIIWSFLMLKCILQQVRNYKNNIDFWQVCRYFVCAIKISNSKLFVMHL